LPKHIEAVNASRHAKTVIFACDPMHGNTITTDQGIKTRHYCHIISELTQSLEVHAKLGSKLQGVHFELTGEVGVTECVGGSMELEESELSRKYESFCDPRLNYGYFLLLRWLIVEQSMDVAFVIAGKLREGKERVFNGM
jgi:3-deoxy-7-phosphoheptulonate synthase